VGVRAYFVRLARVEQVPALVMRSVENARVALDDGHVDKAIKMMTSTDALCSRVVAPPTVHGLALRVLADAYLYKAHAGEGEATTMNAEGDGAGDVGGAGDDGGDGNDNNSGGADKPYVERAKDALNKGLNICKVHDGKAGLPAFMRSDLAGRMGDLYAAMGEIHREEGNYKEALRSLRLAVGKFEELGQKDFIAATINRVAFTYMEKSQWTEALSELEEAEKIASSAESESALLSTTFAYKAKCLIALENIPGARIAYESALKYGMACGNVGVNAEAEEFLARTQSQSTVDDSAFL